MAIEAYLSKYSTVVLSDLAHYGERAAAVAVAEQLSARGTSVTAAQVLAVMAQEIVMSTEVV
jgi:hypothetical protein